MNKIKKPILYLQWILIFFSLLAFFISLIEGFKLPLDISPKGFQEYLKLYTPYSILFAATFIVLTTQLAIERLGLMNDANNNAFKASNRTVWMQITKEFLNDIKGENPIMLKELSKQLHIIHDYLFEKQYRLSSKNDTKEFFDKFFKNKVELFEEVNISFINIACYSDVNHSYSWAGFRYLIIVMVNTDDCYSGFINDLRELYQKEVLVFNNSVADPNAYQVAFNEYIKNSRNGTDIRI